MGRVLATTVILVDEKGQPKVFNEGDEPSKKWADQIDNPKAWKSSKKADKAADDDVPDDDDDDTSADDADQSDDSDTGDDTADDSAGNDSDDSDEEPAPAKNAKTAVWKAYAESKGIELADDASRQDYQDAVAAL